MRSIATTKRKENLRHRRRRRRHRSVVAAHRALHFQPPSASTRAATLTTTRDARDYPKISTVRVSEMLLCVRVCRHQCGACECLLWFSWCVDMLCTVYHKVLPCIYNIKTTARTIYTKNIHTRRPNNTHSAPARCFCARRCRFVRVSRALTCSNLARAAL